MEKSINDINSIVHSTAKFDVEFCNRKFYSSSKCKSFYLNNLKTIVEEIKVCPYGYACIFGKSKIISSLIDDKHCNLTILKNRTKYNNKCSKNFTKIATESGATVVDNSSAFRMEKDVPLIVPEINGEILKSYEGKLISNPNCSTIQGVLPLKNLDRLFGLKRIIFTTYQAVSGSGNKGINDLYANLRGLKPSFYPVDISKNTLPQIGNLLRWGYTEEELKMVNETRKIFSKNIPISSTCVRVPIENCHAVSVEVELKKDFYDEEIKSIISDTEGVKVVDLPLQERASGKDDVFVGRIKRSLAFKNGLSFYCVTDNTLKGASLNAVQIAELLIHFNKI